MILIDSYGWIEYFSDGPLADSYAPFVEEASSENTVTPTVVVYEVYKRIKVAKGEERALEACAQIFRTRIVELTDSIAIAAADISLSMGLGMADSIVLATGRAYGAEVVTSDEHLRGVNGVRFLGE